MQFHLVMTQKCNLQCDYCEGEIDPDMPVDARFSVIDLQRFFSQLDEPPVLAFYGGEPALNPKKIESIMASVPAKAFVIQTNGTVLHKISPEHLSMFHAILLSVDGGPHITDLHRGQGTHERALHGVRYAYSCGFDGDLIARMTINETNDIFEAVTYLLHTTNPSFDHIHWQLDVLWDSDDYYEQRKDELISWIRHSYNPGITRLVNMWLQQIKKGTIPGIVPFMGIMHTLLTNQTVELRCGSGQDFFSITTDGRITVCPIPPSLEFTVGDIYSSKIDEIAKKVVISGPCDQCDVREICGGRCLYANKTMNWGKKGFDLVCSTIRHLIGELQRIQPIIEELILNGSLSLDDFKYPRIPNGVEIIP